MRKISDIYTIENAKRVLTEWMYDHFYVWSSFFLTTPVFLLHYFSHLLRNSLVIAKSINAPERDTLASLILHYLIVSRWIHLRPGEYAARLARPPIAGEYRNKISARSCNLKPQPKKERRIKKEENNIKQKNRECLTHTHTRVHCPTAIISLGEQYKCRHVICQAENRPKIDAP